MESKKIIADANVWIALFNKDDSIHQKSFRYKDLLTIEQIMPDLIFYETLTILRNKCKDNTPLDLFIDFATDNKYLTIRLFYENNIDVLKLFIKEKKGGLSYVDTLLLFLSREYHILTFDEVLKKRIKEHGGKLAD